MKKVRRACLDSSPRAYDEQTKNKFKLESLMQDFGELEKETEEMRKRLQKAKRRKHILLDEVRFLRRRYKFLLKNPSQKIPSGRAAHSQFPSMKNQEALKERNCRENEAPHRRIPVIDLNQIFREDETEEYVWKAPWMEKKSEIPLNEGDASTGDMKLVCRDVRHGSSRSGKRKISWKDQLALRV